MNKINKFFALTLVALTFALNISSVKAQESDLLFGQKHYYSTLFRGNGEAIVYARIVLTNNDTQPQSNFEFEIPKATVSEFVSFQQTLPQQCKRFDYTKRPSTCIEYQDANYDYGYSYYSESNKATYEKITPEVAGQAYKLKLPKPIEPNKSTALVFAYAAKGYVSNFLGKSYFNFETFRVDSRIQSAKVTADVDADQILKGRPAKVNYNQSDSATSTAAREGAGLSAQNIDRVSSQVGGSGPIVKEAKNLAPGETFTVKGEYADSWLILYLGEIFIGILVVLAILLGIYFLSRWMKKKTPKDHDTTQQTKPADSKKPVKTEVIAETVPKHTSAKLGFRESINVLNIGMGLLSAIIAVVLIYSAEWLTDIFQVSNENIGVIVGLGLLVMSLVLIAAPIILVAAKNGWRSLLVSVISMALWLLVLAILASLLFQNDVNENSYYDDTPGGPSIDSTQ